MNIFNRFRGKGYTKNPIGKFLHKHVFTKLRPKLIKVHGFKLYLHKHVDSSSDNLYFEKENYEKEQVEVIKKIVKSGDVVADVGANVGFYTILLSKLVGKAGKVYAFEPEPSNYFLLKKNIKGNFCQNVVCYKEAISNSSKITFFSFNKKSKGGGSLTAKSEHDTKTKVIVETLDNKIKEKVSFIKVDVEGTEIDVLKGAKKLINHNSKINIMLEWFRLPFSDKQKLKKKFNIKVIDGHDAILVRK